MLVLLAWDTDAVQCYGIIPTFRRALLPPSSPSRRHYPEYSDICFFNSWTCSVRTYHTRTWDLIRKVDKTLPNTGSNGTMGKVHNEALQDLYSSPNTLRLSLGSSNQGGWDGRYTWHAWRRLEIYTPLYLQYLNGRDHLVHPCVDGRIILKCILKKPGVKIWTGFICFRIGSSDYKAWVSQKTGNLFTS